MPKIRIVTIAGLSKNIKLEHDKVNPKSAKFSGAHIDSTDTPVVDVEMELPENWNELPPVARINTLGRLSLSIHQNLLKTMNDTMMNLPEYNLIVDPTKIQ